VLHTVCDVHVEFTGIMTILRYFHKCNSSSLKPANVPRQLKTTTEAGVCIDSLEAEVCLHVELKHGKGSETHFNLLFLMIVSSNIPGMHLHDVTDVSSHKITKNYHCVHILTCG